MFIRSLLNSLMVLVVFGFYSVAFAVDETEKPLPAPLSSDDVIRYQKIFGLQELGKWKLADKLIKQLKDPLLLGHVLSQRYLHPTKYRTRYKELKRWLDKYADHPRARQLYKLALRRKPKRWRAPRSPYPWAVAGMHGKSLKAMPKPPRKRLSKKDRQRATQLKRQVRWHLRKGWTKSVKNTLGTREARRVFSTVDMDWARARLGAGYFAAGRDEWSIKWAGPAAKRSGRYLPQAHWTVGLASWRLHRYGDAAKHFEAVVEYDNSPWSISAAAFWAARAHLVNRNPERIMPLLEISAKYGRTFYGLLARRMLGLTNDFRWEMPVLKPETISALLKSGAGRRSLALIQLGEMRRAERELRNLSGRADRELAYGLLAIASRTSMPALAVRLDARLFLNGGGFDGASYPAPDLVPPGGFRVDKALIFALIRQESRFNPRAKSSAGARGLMQLMPRTAGFVAKDRRFRRGKKRRELFLPSTNLDLGQRYIKILLDDANIGSDLFYLATAWNGGPGNLRKWRRTIKHMDDPLFFIESIPSRETRNFIERVLTNLWIYRDRMNQPSPSMEAIAAGEWPVYISLDNTDVEVAKSHEPKKRTRISIR
jgi:soluble lytic murein transglycosylase